MFDNASIMVTGGTGSFGNAFVEYVLTNYKPARLIIYSRDEFKQYKMAQKFDNHPALRFFIGDVRDEDRLGFAMRGVDYLFHAAAMKQVVTAEYNPIECINTNIIGGENIVRVAIRQGVKKVLAISTDKAVKPVNLYGSTKACMEKLFIAANHLAGRNGPRFSNVRYGNVVGSRGSVVPVFLAQRETGTLTITDERMTRFWLRIEDGVKFVVNCAEMMRGGEIFVRKLPSMRVTDLAEAMAPGCKINIVGIRPGEKLHESMVSEEESLTTYEYDDFYVIQPTIKMWTTEESNAYGGQEGKQVSEGFSYSSDINSDWFNVDQLAEMLTKTKVVSE